MNDEFQRTRKGEAMVTFQTLFEWLSGGTEDVTCAGGPNHKGGYEI
jgi:hypothetical protein